MFKSDNPLNVTIATALIALLVAVIQSANAASVEAVRLWHAPDHTRLVFDLSDPVEHRLFTLENPHRLVIDINKTSLKADTTTLEFNRNGITGLRSAVRNKVDLRIVIDLARPRKPRSFMLGSNEQYGDRLVIDLYEPEKTANKTVADVLGGSGKQRDIVIAIDAGHGGDDPGAIGPGKIQEKKVVLAISRELQKLVDLQSGYRAVMVRGGDYYIPLRKRTRIARDSRADIFVSIHADAFKNSQARGASVYALSRRGATSETARYIAQRENRSDLIGGVGSVSLNDKDAMLAGVLVDLSMTAALESSLEIGGKVLKSVGKLTKLHKSRVEQAAFVVLKSPDVPSILIETGFISNPGEAKRLNQRDHQRKLARAIFSGVESYFWARPPVGTLLARLKSDKANIYVIVKGDTLSGIAQRHRVSVKAIQRHNNLKSTRIRVGQHIKIPVQT
jgi:N-acetylmuramoyl-L-alanine amidase